ncbi:hypothetical protein KIW84_012344 [Lathyrus oleraceus]|uniref:Uncharacterized protein n=1 Tax=Pisum sativum TaxID=3888 RepID=A0A9D5GW65_PEA|nr:hypothetical protein KIW84_012344 [Pisum sativum]
MYTNEWELSEHESFEPFSIVTPLEDITTIIHETNKSFQPQQQYYQQQIEFPIWSNEFSMETTTESPFQFFQENYSNNIAKQDQPTTSFDFVVESLMSASSEDSISYSEKCSELASCSDNKPICENSPQQHKKVLEGYSALHQKSREVSFQKTQLESCINQDKQSSPCGFDFSTSTNYDSKITTRNKRRLRWTKEMHEPFVMIVNQLGGAEKAKPKAILQMMGLDVLNISHVKSHLQVLLGMMESELVSYDVGP